MIWIEKQKHLIDFAISSLMRYWKKNLALVTVYTLVVFVLASVMFFTYALKREAMLVLAGSPDIVVQRLLAGRNDLMPARCIDILHGIAGVSEVQGRLWAYYFDPSVGANFTIIVKNDKGNSPGGIAIGRGVARALAAGMGDLVAFRGHDGTYQSFEVQKIFQSDSELITADLVVMSEIDFRSLFGIPRTFYTDVTMRIKNPQEINVVKDKIRRMLPDTRPILRADILRTYDAVFDWRSGLLLVIFAGSILAFFIFAWDKATSLSMEERREIGILKAIGWDTSEVIIMKSWEGLVISSSSFLMGIILAYIHVFFASGSLFEPVLKGWSVIYPDFKLVPIIELYQVAVLFFITVIPYTVATIIPSWLAASVDPDLVMRL